MKVAIFVATHARLKMATVVLRMSLRMTMIGNCTAKVLLARELDRLKMQQEMPLVFTRTLKHRSEDITRRQYCLVQLTVVHSPIVQWSFIIICTA